MRVGVLALQGDAEEHEYAIKRASEELGINVDVIRVKNTEQLSDLNALVIPGGESTTIGSLARRTGLLDRLRGSIINGLPTLGTCAGAIFMAREVRDSVVGETGQPILGVMDIAVVRNAFGRQRDSFETDLSIDGIGTVRAVFIRAPAIIKAWGNARPLAYVKHPKLGNVIAAAQENSMIATVFHPELTTMKIHKYLLEVAMDKQR
ncbi:pyridoxal 5'-phosphate synthase glutaminase subunit PdxT [Vulcanisaeta souniana]|uniref:Pyridoxal 5'-phosphate synthase subunit PdxT n=1 Tax=Vulcanisaeta souniana JCM 11219 TaxID=1293586 RepID=A0A830E6I5_9CREN|nr:pyridoxal 5'-phosphate synthase glutaminase subunit PdxT [Vulcanisaeta souniana]BDR92345.1 pyridoxal 5'-phosphate synthase glutaminase subunit PdxT [Vulcanisaeta souniana JCM 11219]GGI74872.1 pyridoxal 5'-phosphate synthase glutaminase subunit PdxT [Vulcanisaeta souniana JCM 11219]